MIQDKPTKATVLILNHANGYQAVHGDPHIQVKIINCPPTDSIESELALEQFLDNILPPRFKEIYFPGMNLIATGMIKPITLGDVNRIVLDLEHLYQATEVPQRYQTHRSRTLKAMEA